MKLDAASISAILMCIVIISIVAIHVNDERRADYGYTTLDKEHQVKAVFYGTIDGTPVVTVWYVNNKDVIIMNSKDGNNIEIKDSNRTYLVHTRTPNSSGRGLPEYFVLYLNEIEVQGTTNVYSHMVGGISSTTQDEAVAIYSP